MTEGGHEIGEERARVGELEIAYETFGDPADPAVLLVMGLGSQMINWPEELCERLAAAGLHVIRFDNRDAGRSTVLGEVPAPEFRRVAAGEAEPPYPLSDMAADAVGLLDHLGVERAHLVGASLGGMIAQRVAIDHPDRVLSLASIMSTTGERSVGLPSEAAREVLLTRAPSDRDGYVEATLRARGVIGSQPPDEARTRVVRRARLRARLSPRGHRAPARRDRRHPRSDRGAGASCGCRPWSSTAPRTP